MGTHTHTTPLRRAHVAAYRARQRLIEGTRRRLLGTITHVATAEPVVALTFDDGPHPEYTPALLDVLAHHNAKATFFVIGQQVERHPEIAKRALAEGHSLANHTWDHPLFLTISSEQRRQQIRACNEILGNEGVRMFRPPKGHQSLQSRLDIMRSGCDVVTWNVHAEDWRRHDAEWMAQRLLQKITPGSIVLLHDAIWDPMEEGVTNRIPVIAAVDLLLRQLHGRMQFVTVPNLLRYGRAVRESWFRS